MYTTLEELIREYVSVPYKKNAQGWHRILCRVCNDHGRKGKRAGFKFDPLTGAVGYNCFNCGASFSFDPEKNNRVPKKVRSVLSYYGIPSEELTKFEFTLLSNEEREFVSKEKVLLSNIKFKEQSIPDYFLPVTEKSDHFLVRFAIKYLKETRNIDDYESKFFVCDENSNPVHRKWTARLILPVYKDKKLIFYQGLDMVGTSKRKYLNLNVEKGHILYGFDRLKQDDEQVILYVTEGWFDAYHLNGVAVFGNKMSQVQIAFLRKCPARKVIVPDRSGDGEILANQAINLGWEISTPDTGSAKDIDEAIREYGTMYVKNTVRQSIHSGELAKNNLRDYCRSR